MRIAVATSRDHRTEDPDLPLLRAAAEDTGVRLDVVPWDDPDIDFDHYDLTIIRSCWDYVPRRTEFLAWTERVPRLHNSAAVVAWNTDKTYLRQLERCDPDQLVVLGDLRHQPFLDRRQEVVEDVGRIAAALLIALRERRTGGVHTEAQAARKHSLGDVKVGYGYSGMMDSVKHSFFDSSDMNGILRKAGGASWRSARLSLVLTNASPRRGPTR